MARPNLSYLKNVFLLMFGLPFGVLTGLTGLGNSSAVLLPAVRWLLGLRPARASATALAVTAFAALAGLLAYAQHGGIRVGLGVWLTFGQILGAAWGMNLAQRTVPPLNTRLRVPGALLALALGLALAAQGRGLWHWQPWFMPLHGLEFWSVALAVAILVGMCSSLTGLGGVFLIPALVELLHLPPYVAQGTALIVLLLAALPGMIIHSNRGELEPQATVWLSVGAVFGALVGAYGASQIRSEPLLLLIYGLLLIVIGLVTLWPPRNTDGAFAEAEEPRREP